jgi:hypothetical protein
MTAHKPARRKPGDRLAALGSQVNDMCRRLRKLAAIASDRTCVEAIKRGDYRGFSHGWLSERAEQDALLLLVSLTAPQAEAIAKAMAYVVGEVAPTILRLEQMIWIRDVLVDLFPSSTVADPIDRFLQKHARTGKRPIPIQ